MCSISLARREMQIKTTLSFHLAPVRMAMVKKTTNKCWQVWGMGNPYSLNVGGTANWCSLYGNQCGQISKKLKVDLCMIQLHHSPWLCPEDSTSTSYSTDTTC